MSSSLTPTQIANHLACQHLTQLERQQREGRIDVAFVPDPRLDALRERGLQHEQEYVSRLRGAGLTVCDLRDQRDAAATLRAMGQRFDVIVQATLAGVSINGVADVLLRAGAVYEPVDTKLSFQTRAGTILQLCAYAEMLRDMQGVAPEHVHVVTPVDTQTYRTSDFSAYYRMASARTRTASTAEPAPETYPQPVEHCDACRYWQHCDRQRRADDHPSLIASIRHAQVVEFAQQGLPTVSKIADADGVLPARPKRGAVDTYRHLGHQARVQVASRGLEQPIVEALPVEPGRGLTRMPSPSSGDIFLDFEGDPFVAPGGLEYLLGTCCKDDQGRLVLSQQWAWGPAEEKAALESFIDLAMAAIASAPTAHVYHFGAYEPATLKRLAARHATRGPEVDQLLRGQRFVDLHIVVREAFRIGIERYGLKELESLHAFQRQLDLRAAAAVRRTLELALELGDAATVSEETRRLVALYNADDCLSTESLRAWLERQRESLVAGGAEIPRPTIGQMAPSEDVSAHDQRIADLRESLLQGLPKEVESRTEDERARALLASMLGYYRQESKNAWWEYFRLRDLPPEEHLDERYVVGGLEFVEALPKQGRERNPRWRFSFPAQETSIEVGKDVQWAVLDELNGGIKTLKAKVEAFDAIDRMMVLGMNADAIASPPTAVFKDPVVSAKPLESSLLEYAENVRDNGWSSTGPYACANDLLRALAPRLMGHSEGPLLREDEPAGDALSRLCLALDGGVLPVQGPPGAGKTTQAARAILALVGAGKKVGITAVSHAVVENLLKAVHSANARSDHPMDLGIVHKGTSDARIEGIEFAKNNEAALKRVAPNTVVGGTAWLWADSAAIDSLDVLVIDEAGQMSLASALAVSRSARNLLLLGDPQQLEQPTRGAHEDGADVAALVHLVGVGQATIRADRGLFMDRTFRLHPAICRFTSETYYEGRLAAAEGQELQSVGGSGLFAGADLFFVAVAHEGNQAHAPEEVEAVVSTVRSLLLPDTTWTNERGEVRPLRTSDILVVAPYNAQVSALRRALAELDVMRVGTVDKFQGQEAPVVIYSCTSSSAEDAPRGMAFLYDPHRFNVATSRARGVVIVVGSPRLFEPECRTPAQMAWANGLCRFAELATPVHLPA